MAHGIDVRRCEVEYDIDWDGVRQLAALAARDHLSWEEVARGLSDCGLPVVDLVECVAELESKYQRSLDNFDHRNEVGNEARHVSWTISAVARRLARSGRPEEARHG